MNLNVKIPKEIKIYIEEVEEMQSQQSKYFQTRSPIVLNECKRLEKSVRQRTQAFKEVLKYQEENNI